MSIVIWKNEPKTDKDYHPWYLESIILDPPVTPRMICKKRRNAFFPDSILFLIAFTIQIKLNLDNYVKLLPLKKKQNKHCYNGYVFYFDNSQNQAN